MKEVIGYKKKRVLLIARHPAGGILTYFKYIYSQSCFDEYNFTVLLPTESLKKDMADIFLNRELEFICFYDNKDMFNKTNYYLKNNKVNLVHTHGFTAGSIVSILAYREKTPHLMTAHDIFQQSQFKGIKGNVKLNVLSMAFRLINKIHTVGHEATDNFKEYFPHLQDKIHCIENGIDSERFFNAIADKDNREGGVYHIGFFGRFMSQKGFRFLVDAVEKIRSESRKNIKLKVLTYGWGGYIREEFEAIEKRGLKDFFEMMPYTEDMPRAIKGVDLVVMPSLWEAYPLLAMEALVAGVPIVGTGCIGLNEVLVGSPAKIIPLGNSDALAEAIVEEMQQRRKQVFLDYALEAKQRFSLKVPSAGLKKLYIEMTNN